VLSDKCRPSTLCSTALAYFTKRPSVNSIQLLYFLPVLPLNIIIAFRIEVFRILQNIFKYQSFIRSRSQSNTNEAIRHICKLAIGYDFCQRFFALGFPILVLWGPLVLGRGTVPSLQVGPFFLFHFLKIFVFQFLCLLLNFSFIW
jgi:hypothetical protein